jgi:hypothetical protein
MSVYKKEVISPVLLQPGAPKQSSVTLTAYPCHVPFSPSPCHCHYHKSTCCQCGLLRCCTCSSLVRQAQSRRHYLRSRYFHSGCTPRERHCCPCDGRDVKQASTRFIVMLLLGAHHGGLLKDTPVSLSFGAGYSSAEAECLTEADRVM